MKKLLLFAKVTHRQSCCSDKEGDSKPRDSEHSRTHKEGEGTNRLKLELAITDYAGRGAAASVVKLSAGDRPAYFLPHLLPDDLSTFIVDESAESAQDAYFVVTSRAGAFQLMDTGSGSGTFLKLEEPTLLLDEGIMSFGDNHVLTQIDATSKELTLQFIAGSKTGEKRVFSPTDMLFIGRMCDCRVKFEDENLSRYQSRIEYTERGWLLSDGDGQKSSMNGTWVFVGQETELRDGLVFKAGRHVFRTKLTL